MISFEPVIGLEVHARLLTRSKMFCGAPNDADAPPNTLITPVSLGLPGTLPVLNKEAVNLALKAGLACDCTMTRLNRFDRKHYFYPDLPKGYQITQMDTPLCRKGALTLLHPDFYGKSIAIDRIHLEEDAGKSIHNHDSAHTLIDLNRAGAPLIEMVTEPVINSPEEAAAFVFSLRTLLRYLGVSDGNMESGSLRCDANISLRPKGETRLGTRVELKNINSFAFLRKALKSEIDRQTECLLSGREIERETRGYDSVQNITFPQRGKEEAWDYRYMPEPDIPAFEVHDNWLETLRLDMPVLPHHLYSVMAEQKVDKVHAITISNDRALADFYLEAAPSCKDHTLLARWVLDPVAAIIKSNQDNMESITRLPESVSKIINAISENRINQHQARKKVFSDCMRSAETDCEDIIARNEAGNGSEDDLVKLVEKVIEAHEKEVHIFVSGKTAILDFFMGEVMRAGKEVYDPGHVKKILGKALNRRKMNLT